MKKVFYSSLEAAKYDLGDFEVENLLNRLNVDKNIETEMESKIMDNDNVMIWLYADDKLTPIYDDIDTCKLKSMLFILPEAYFK